MPCFRNWTKSSKHNVSKYTTKVKDAKGKEKTQKMSAEHVKAAKLGLLKIQRAVADKVTRKVIQDSFRQTGIYPLDVNQVFSQFSHAEITDNDKLLFCDKLPKMKKCIRQNGEISDKDFDAMGFPATTVKDGKRLNQRRVVVVTGKNLIGKTAQHSQEDLANAPIVPMVVEPVVDETPPARKRGRPPKQQPLESVVTKKQKKT
jgi:hypothetical protein